MTQIEAPRTGWWSPVVHDGNRQALVLLRTGFTVAPILFGVDKFTRVLTGDIARRDAGLLIGALALAAVASAQRSQTQPASPAQSRLGSRR